MLLCPPLRWGPPGLLTSRHHAAAGQAIALDLAQRLDEGTAGTGGGGAARAGHVTHHARGVDGDVGEAEEDVALLAAALQGRQGAWDA